MAAKKRIRKTCNRTASKTCKRPVKPWISAAIIGGFSGRVVEQYVRVAVNFDGITPSVPNVIKVEKSYFTLVETNPLRYRVTTFGKAEKLASL